MAQPRRSSFLRKVTHPLYRKLETNVHPLRYLFLEITRRCNLNCLHCGSDCGRTAFPNELTLEEWLAFLDYVTAHFDTRQLALVLTGGEPFCHPHFKEIISRIRRNHMAWGLVTNGLAVDEAAVRMLLASGLRSATVSVDGLEDSHDWLRAHKGAFNKAINAARLLAEARLPSFDVVTCVNPRNLKELPDILEVLKKTGVPAWRLFTIFPIGRADRNRDLLLTDEQLRKLLAWISETRKNGTAGNIRVDFSCEGFLPPRLDRQVRDEPYFCRAGIAIGSVLCDGTISACPNISRSLAQGNIRTDDFKKVWDERFQLFRDRSWMRQGECASCSKWSRCMGNSLHLWDADNNRTLRCFWKAATE